MCKPLNQILISILYYLLILSVGFILLNNNTLLPAKANESADITSTDKDANTLFVYRAIMDNKFDVAASFIENGAAINLKHEHENLFAIALLHLMPPEVGIFYIEQMPDAIILLERLLKVGADPNERIFYYIGDYNYYDFPLSYIIRSCVSGEYKNGTYERNFYLEMTKLLLTYGADLNTHNIIKTPDYGKTISTINDRLAWVEIAETQNSDISKCVEAKNYLENYIKENNIIIED